MTRGHHTPIRDAFRFFGHFLRRPGSIGAVLPSSRFLARALVGELVHLAPGDSLVEYGPGTGAITRQIAAQLPDGVDYLGIELEPSFVESLRARFPRLRFHAGSVADVDQIVAEAGIAPPARIISGLPFASLPVGVQHGIVRGTADVLAPAGQFRTFQYVHAYPLPNALRFREAMREHFGRVERSKPVLRNVPPAFVLSYSRSSG